MAKKTAASTSKKIINKINVRMYRIGTGDFFLLQLMNNSSVRFNIMVDCGCILGSKADFKDKVEDLADKTGGNIDLLIVTHEHADHINGFEKSSDIFDKKLKFKKVWFAWTEANEPFANNFRKEHTKMKMALQMALIKLNQLSKDSFFDKMFDGDSKKNQLLAANSYFLNSLNALNELNLSNGPLSLSKIKTMEDILRQNKIIKQDTVVEFYEPGNMIENLKGAEGIRFFVLGPPKDNDAIKQEEIKGEGYEKRKSPSTVDMSFQKLLLQAADNISESETHPFDDDYILSNTHPVKTAYEDHKNFWRNIDNDWLLSAGSLALRHETSINNTSLAIAIQFMDSEKILLFPGDAEQGSWLSWHNKLEWTFKNKDKKVQKVNAEYILQNTVFYKVSHHLSQNGTPKARGLELMKQEDMAAMVTLDFKKINSGWLNTMPNDLIGEELIRKTKGKIFFVGDRKKILKNIQTNRTSVSKTNLNSIDKLNKPYDGKFYIDYEVSGTN